jgi:Ca-activated chloride channel family protein
VIEQFHFLRPGWLLLLVPLFVLLWLLLRSRADGGNWREVIDARLLPFVLSDGEQSRRGYSHWIFTAVAAVGIVALAGPTWEKLPQPAYLRQSAMVIALDLSRSMNATDIRPNRLVRARHKIADILDLRKEGQTALLAYAADAFTVTPLTSDTDTIKSLLSVLESDIMPAQGSRADRALQRAFELLQDGGVDRGDVLLISDGLSDFEVERVESMLGGNPGHRLSVLAIGTLDGGPLPLRNGGFLKDRDGAIVIAGMQEDNLRRVAQSGGGVYASISTDDIDINTLTYLMESSLDQREAKLASGSADLWRELGPWLLLLVLPLAALAFRRGLVWMLPLSVMLLPPDAQALDWQSLWQNDDQRASRLFERGEHAEAAEMFERPEWRASSKYRSGDYAAALQTWQRLEGEDALYNRANALAQLGRYEEALSAYATLLRDNPEHQDALYNKRAIEAFLEQQQQQQGGQQDDQQQDASQDHQQQQGEQGDQRPQDQEGKHQQGERQGQDGDQQQAEQQQQNDSQDSQAQQQAEQQRQPGQDDSQNPDQQDSAQPGSQQARADEQDSSDQGQDEESEAEELARLDQQMSEQAAQQWLRKIQDDPGGLLREKFLYQHRKRGGAEAEAQPW